MSTLAYPYYTLSTQMEDLQQGKKTTKSIAAINLPDMTSGEVRNQVAGDLQRVSYLLSGIMQNNYQKTTLTTREEVI